MLVLVLIGDFNLPNLLKLTKSPGNTVQQRRQSRKFLCGEEISDRAGERPNKGRCPAGTAVFEQRRTVGSLDGWRPSGAQQL